MQRPSLSARLRYAFDNAVAQGPAIMFGWIALFALLAIFLISLLVVLTGVVTEQNVLEQFWAYIMLTLEPDAPDSPQWTFRFATLLVIFVGVLLVGTLIGTITTAMEDRLEAMRQGRSRVIESGHTVILGWSEPIFTIVGELSRAYAHEGGACVVILGDHTRVEMETELRERVGSTGRTRVVCRQGQGFEPADLALVSLATSRAIIILAPAGENADAVAIKTLLAIVNNPERRDPDEEPYHIVMHLHDPKNARLAKMVGGDEVEVVVTAEFIARIAAQTCRQSGLSTVYADLLDFHGDDIYFRAVPELVGRCYDQALLAFDAAAVMGLRRPGEGSMLNPPADTVIEADDEIIAVAEYQHTVVPNSGEPVVQRELMQQPAPAPSTPEHTVILGWNWTVPHIITELDDYVAAGSRVTVASPDPAVEVELARRCRNLQRQTLSFLARDTTDREMLEELPLDSVDHVIIVACMDSLGVQQADARTIITLLHLREIIRTRGLTCSVVSEVLDVRNRSLVTVTQDDDFVVSDQLISFFLAQISENKARHAVYAELFDAQGMEIYLKPAGAYVQTGTPVNFYTLVAAAAQRGETAIGYRIHALAGSADDTFGVVLNPPKTATISLAQEDKLIVLADG